MLDAIFFSLMLGYRARLLDICALECCTFASFYDCIIGIGMWVID